MADTPEMTYDEVERRPLKEFTEKAYLDYSMYVVLDRALPHIGDGLKPVQRRIIYAMSQLGLNAGAKHMKSARTVGDTLGKFHPHGESACYEAMVLMAQPFSFRYPVIDGQGNWGSADDPKSFAAMRYTEAKLTRFAEVLLGEIRQGTVEWTRNYDDSQDEPTLLPARLPHVLLNGSSGIAVGMSTDLPPHNLREIADACVRLIDEPKAPLDALLEHLVAPDFPTEAEIITSPADIRRIYETGSGSLRMRAVYEPEDGAVVVTALPYQVSGGRVQEQVAAQIKAKKLPWVDDVREESDHENPTRLVIVLRSNRVDVERLMSHLFATTDLERTYRVNMNVIGIDGRPQLKNLRAILTEWLEFRIQTVTRRLEHRLERVLARLHILDGQLIAFLNIDEVIAIIRTEDEPKPVLMSRFSLSDVQAEAILETKLRNLARLEEMRIRGEQADLGKERDTLQKNLGSRRRIKRLIRDDIVADREKFGDARRSPVVGRSAAVALGETDLAPSEPVSVVLSEKGWVRAAKGHDVDPTGLGYRSGDAFKSVDRGRTTHQAVFLDSTGRSYSLGAHTLPSARGHGEPLSGRLKPPDGATFEGVMVGAEDERFLLASSAGYGFVARLGDLIAKNKAGKVVLSLPAGSRVLAPRRVPAGEGVRVAAVTSDGYLLVVDLAELPELPRGKGMKVIQIPPARFRGGDEWVVDMVLLAAGQPLTAHAGKRHLTLRPGDLELYDLGRGRRGRKLPRGLQRVDRLAAD